MSPPLKNRSRSRTLSKIHLVSRSFLPRFWRLLSQPIFIALTIFGSTVILTGTFLLYYLEKETNPAVRTLLDSLWWAVSTVTTVGYGDIVPITVPGKIMGIILMFVGIALFWSYTALFAEAIISKDLTDLESKLSSIKRVLSEIDKKEVHENEDLKLLVADLEKQIKHLHARED